MSDELIGTTGARALIKDLRSSFTAAVNCPAAVYKRAGALHRYPCRLDNPNLLGNDIVDSMQATLEDAVSAVSGTKYEVSCRHLATTFRELYEESCALTSALDSLPPPQNS